MTGGRATTWRIGAAGLALAVALAATAIVGGAAWRGWLAACQMALSIPVGALMLAMVARLVPGAWAEELARPLRTLPPLALLPGLLLAPLLVAPGLAYPWALAGAESHGAFRDAWLSPPLFITRGLLVLAALAAGAWLFSLRNTASKTLACIGLIAMAVLSQFASTDWILSLDPDFSSSGFGLFVFAGQALNGFAAALVLAAGAPRDWRPRFLGGLLLVFLLLWAYLGFMHFFITWSDNLPPGATWYLRRGGVWRWVEDGVATIRLGALALLLFAPFRERRRPLMILGALVLASGAGEFAWLILPASRAAPALTPLAGGLYLLDLVALGLAAWAALGLVRRRLERAP